MDQKYIVLKFACHWDEIPGDKNPIITRRRKQNFPDNPDYPEAPKYCLVVCSEGLRSADTVTGLNESFCVLDCSEEFSHILHLGSFWNIDLAEDFAKHWAGKRNRALLNKDQFEGKPLVFENDERRIEIKRFDKYARLSLESHVTGKHTVSLFNANEACQFVNYLAVMFDMEVSDMEGVRIAKQ